MKRTIVLVGLVFGFLAGCASAPDSRPKKADRETELDQLMVLYKESRTKFVIQKQQMIQASSCKRVIGLHQVAKVRAKDAEMSPDSNVALIAVVRELAQAEKECRKK